MKWKKLGKIFCADRNSAIMYSGGRAPLPFLIKGNVFKLFFASYDEDFRGRIFYLTLDIENPTKPLEISNEPVIDIGNIGCYDDNGIIPSCIIKNKNNIFLYTIGFSIKNKLIFDAASGLAVSKDNGKNFKKFEGPIIDKSIYDPCFAASPCVIFDKNLFRMWYVSCERWEKIQNNKYKHYYNIKYAESKDGINWNRGGKIAIGFKNKYEYAISRPFVVKDGEDNYKMWYSYRAQKNIDTYRIGYAESKDGINWTRKDEEAGIDVSDEGWDSEMICYPYVFDHKGKRYMLYNGNGYGKTGFGIAVLE